MKITPHRAVLACALVGPWANTVTAQIPAAGPGQTYPAKPVRLVVTGVTGGSDDFHARVVAQRMGDALGHQVIIDNRPGGGGLIGRTAVIGAAADGYALLF